MRLNIECANLLINVIIKIILFFGGNLHKINITTLGCPKNEVDSRQLVELLESEGFIYVGEANEADILLVNTCGFIGDAKRESIEEILRLSRFKGDQESGSLQKRLVVFGCLAKRYKEEIMSEIPEIDALFGVGEEKDIISYCKGIVNGSRLKANTGALKSVTDIARSYAYLKIAEGCDKKCTFCVIPSIRGRFRSISPEAILKDAERQISKGARELILVAQDITSYGKDLGGYSLVSLLKDISSISGDFRIRLLYLYPTEISNELLEYIAVERKIQKYIDMPLQHSEDKMLRLMGRRGTKRDYIKLIRNIRRIIPGIAIRTTFIVGFPGETEEDFKGLLDFIEELRFDRLGAFKYSKEEGTPAEKMKGHLPEGIKIRRLNELMITQNHISLEKNRELIGRRFEVIVDEVDKDTVVGRLYSHAPEIDGAVIIQNRVNKIQKTDNRETPKLRVGDIVNVEITDAYDYDLVGRVIVDN